MKIENSIGWCDATTNAVTGCDKVSPGCKNCYAEAGTRARVLRAQGIETWGLNGARHPVAEFVEKIRRLNKLCVCDRCHEAQPFEARLGKFCSVKWCRGKVRRIRLFADSNSDWLDEKWEIETLAEFLKEIHDAPNVDVLLLTKRPENFFERLDLVWDFVYSAGRIDFALWIDRWMAKNSRNQPPKNVWLGVSAENQAMADLRIPQLLQIPAAVRFLSCEPLLEKIDLRLEVCDEAFRRGAEKSTRGACAPLDWVIVGGESGPDGKRRDCGAEAIVNIAEQCREADVPAYVKQDCAFKSGQQGRIPDHIWGMKQFPRVE